MKLPQPQKCISRNPGISVKSTRLSVQRSASLTSAHAAIAMSISRPRDRLRVLYSLALTEASRWPNGSDVSEGNNPLLRSDFARQSRSPQPLIQHDGRNRNPLTVCNQTAERRSRPPCPGEAVDENRRVQDNHIIACVTYRSAPRFAGPSALPRVPGPLLVRCASQSTGPGRQKP